MTAPFHIPIHLPFESHHRFRETLTCVRPVPKRQYKEIGKDKQKQETDSDGSKERQNETCVQYIKLGGEYTHI